MYKSPVTTAAPMASQNARRSSVDLLQDTIRDLSEKRRQATGTSTPALETLVWLDKMKTTCMSNQYLHEDGENLSATTFNCLIGATFLLMALCVVACIRLMDAN